LCNLYGKCSSAPKVENNILETGTLQLQARALSDLHFVLSEISPLTTVQRYASENDESVGKPQNRHNSSSAEAMRQYQHELMDSVKRMDLLFEIYPQLPPSFMKAKVAYALGHYATFSLDDIRLAEQLFFESLIYWIMFLH
jgi:hypothetical protein